MRNRAFKWLSHACRIVLGVTFIFSGFVKTVDPWGTAIKIQEYLSIYGLESLSGLRFGFSIWLCGAELMMGLMLLFKVRIRLISIFALASMIFFTVLTFLSATWLPVEDCGCFGDAVKLTPWETFAKNLVLLPLSVVVWWRYRRDRIFAFSKAEEGCTVLFFSLAMGLGIYCYAHLPLIDFRPFKVGENIYEAMNAYSADPGPQAGKTVLIYRDRQTGRLHEFSLDDTELAGCRALGVGRYPYRRARRAEGRSHALGVLVARCRRRRHRVVADSPWAGLHALYHRFRGVGRSL